MSEASRKLARQIFNEAMAATTVDAACRRLLRVMGNMLHAGPYTYDLSAFREIQIISIGKAGATLYDALRSILPGKIPTRAIISAPFPPTFQGENTQYFQGGHPLPNQASLEAAKAALDLLSTANKSTLVLFLISGGASAMFEQPLGFSLPDLIELNRQLVASGAPIEQINAVRKHLSAVKGGRLAAAAPDATHLSLFISDVPAHALDALASGPTLPDSTTVATCREVVAKHLNAANLPPAVRTILEGPLPETPKPGDPLFANQYHVVLLDNAALLEAAAESATALGFHVVIDNGCDDWDYEAAADYLLNRAQTSRTEHARLCLLSGGEVTVRLPADSGAGGRNQQLALYAAKSLQQATLLCAGSDGIDGNSPAAGCVVDETTLTRAHALGLEAETALAAFNAYPLLSALGDAIVTGPSGNNLRDIRILLTSA